MKLKIIGIILLLFISLGFFLFHSLGGFNPIELEIRDWPETELAGIHYRGTPQSEKLAEAFKTIENLQKKNPGSDLYTIYFIEPSGKKDTMEVFVGLESSFLEDTDSLIKMEITSGPAIVADIKKHLFVMPSPNSIKKEIESFALSRNLSKPTLFIDKIVGPSDVQVIAPIPD